MPFGMSLLFRFEVAKPGLVASWIFLVSCGSFLGSDRMNCKETPSTWWWWSNHVSNHRRK